MNPIASPSQRRNSFNQASLDNLNSGAHGVAFLSPVLPLPAGLARHPAAPGNSRQQVSVRHSENIDTRPEPFCLEHRN